MSEALPAPCMAEWAQLFTFLGLQRKRAPEPDRIPYLGAI